MRVRMPSERSIEARRCKEMTRKGEPCKLWAVWGDTRCNRHGGSANGRVKEQLIWTKSRKNLDEVRDASDFSRIVIRNNPKVIRNTIFRF